MSKPRPEQRPDRKTVSLDIGGMVLRLRQERGLSGVEFCRRAQDLDPKTLTAIEKGRIRNPSIASLQSLARGFGMTVSDLFRQAELMDQRYFHLGTQKGLYKLDFPSKGVQLISFTPLSEEFFCGKVIIESDKKFEDTLLAHKGVLFVQVLIGHVEGEAEGKEIALKEGESLYLRGGIRFRLSNPIQRNASLFLVTVPSCVSGGQPFLPC